MSNDFEDQLLKDIVTPDILEIYAHYERRFHRAQIRRCLPIDLYDASTAADRTAAELATGVSQLLR